MIRLVVFLTVLIYSSQALGNGLKCAEYHLNFELILFGGQENLIEIPPKSKLVVFEQTGDTALVEIEGPKDWFNPFGDTLLPVSVERLKSHTCISGKTPTQSGESKQCFVHKTGQKSIEGIPPETIVKITKESNIPSWATQLEYYQNGKLLKKTVSKKILKENSTCLETDDSCPYRSLNKKVLKIEKGSTVEIVKTESWYHIVRFLDVNNKSIEIKVGQSILKNNSECTIFDPNKIIKEAQPTKPCPEINFSQSTTNKSQKSTPQARSQYIPDDSLTDPYLNEKKGQQDLDQYLSCYKRTKKLNKEYEDKYKSAISEVVDEFIESSNHEYDTQEIRTIFTCLLFRESAQWEAKNSPTGATGFGQFTNDGIEEVESLFKRFPFKEKDLNDDLKYLYSFENKTNEIRSRIATVEALKISLNRNNKIKEFYSNLRKRDSKLPALDTSDSDIDRKISKTSLSDKSNYKFTFALSMAKMMNCVSQYRSYFDAKKVSPKSKVFMACAGAYNIGTGGFRKNALGKNRAVQFSDWMHNLKNSDVSQRHETQNHLISIQRCTDQSSNYPQCGTKPDAQCFNNTLETNPCSSNTRYTCNIIDKNSNKVGTECD